MYVGSVLPIPVFVRDSLTLFALSILESVHHISQTHIPPNQITIKTELAVDILIVTVLYLLINLSIRGNFTILNLSVYAHGLPLLFQVLKI